MWFAPKLLIEKCINPAIRKNLLAGFYFMVMLSNS